MSEKDSSVERLIGSVWAPMALLAAMQLELFTPLSGAPAESGVLARALGVRVEKLEPLLHALVAAGLLERQGPRFANTEEAERLLVRGKPDYIGSVHELLADIWGAMLRTAESIRTARPQAKHDFRVMPDEELRAFFRGLHPRACTQGRELSTRLEFGDHRRLLDVAGGSGGFSIGACESCPGLSATVVDLPRVVPITRDFVSNANLSERIRVLERDVVARHVEPAHDLAVMRAFLQVLSRDDARHALQNVGRSLEPGARIVILGRVLDDDRAGPEETVGFNLVFLNVYDEGQAYTEGEYRQWLAEAGFEGVQRETQSDGTSIITARKRS